MSARGPVNKRIPAGDTRERLVCDDCNFVFYDNPKIVLGSVVVADDGRILLCRRAIEPSRGLWTIPAGFMELSESAIEGAAREALEEACAKIEIDALLGVYSIPRISQVQLIYRARLASSFAAGEESLEVKLFTWDEIPWKELAFSSVLWALRDYERTRGQHGFAPAQAPAP